MKKLIILLVITSILFSCDNSVSQKKHEAKPVVDLKENIGLSIIDHDDYTEQIRIDTLDGYLSRSYCKKYKNGNSEQGYIIFSPQDIPIDIYNFNYYKKSPSSFYREEYDVTGKKLKRISIKFDFESSKLLSYEKSNNFWQGDEKPNNYRTESYDVRKNVISVLKMSDFGEGMVDDYLIKANIVTPSGKKEKLDFDKNFARISEEAFTEFNKFLQIPTN